MKRWGLLLVVVGLVGCTSQKDQNWAKFDGAGIINGELVTEKDPLLKGIVGVYDLENNAICTGSLIQENIVLTAAHCLKDVRKNMIRVVFGVDVDSLMATREPDIFREYVRNIEGYVIHEEYGQQPEEQEWDLYDIALIKIKGKAPEGFAPVKMLPSKDYLVEGQNVLLAGYGVSELKTTKIDASTYEDLEDALMYGEVFCHDEELKDCVKVESSGDGELRKTTVSLSKVLASEVVLSEKETGTCFGDSGGPAYVMLNDEPHLFGVTSRGSALCDELGVYTNALDFTEWIENNILELWY